MSSTIRTLIAEGVGTCLLVFLAVGAAVLGVAAKVGVVGVWPGTVAIAAALAVALVLLGVLAAVGPLSGSHLAPAVTLALLRRRRLPADVAVDSWIGQATGAVIAGFGLYLFVPWATGFNAPLFPGDRSPDAGNLVLQDVLIAGLGSVILLVAPLVGVALVAALGASDRLLLEAAPRTLVATPVATPAPVPVPTASRPSVREPAPSPTPISAPAPLPTPEAPTTPEPRPVPGPLPAPEPFPGPRSLDTAALAEDARRSTVVATLGREDPVPPPTLVRRDASPARRPSSGLIAGDLAPGPRNESKAKRRTEGTSTVTVQAEVTDRKKGSRAKDGKQKKKTKTKTKKKTTKG